MIANVMDPTTLVAFLPVLCHKMELLYCIVKGKARVGHPVQRRAATHSSPSHRLIWKTKGFWRSCWKPSGDKFNDRFDETHHHWEAASGVQNLWLSLPSWKRQRQQNLPPNWVKCTLSSFLHIKIIKIVLPKKLKFSQVLCPPLFFLLPGVLSGWGSRMRKQL